jgi:predicted MFS family arabinose efflux permease
VLNSLTKTATGYLPERSRPTGIALGSAGQFVGAILALVMGPLLEHKHSLGPLLPVQAALAVAAATVLALVTRRPPAESGPRAAIGLDELKAAWSVPMIRTLAQLAFVGIGVFVALSTYLQPILHHNHISSTSAGVMLAGMLIAGTIGCGTLPPIIARMGGGLLRCAGDPARLGGRRFHPSRRARLGSAGGVTGDA